MVRYVRNQTKVTNAPPPPCFFIISLTHIFLASRLSTPKALPFHFHSSLCHPETQKNEERVATENYTRSHALNTQTRTHELRKLGSPPNLTLTCMNHIPVLFKLRSSPVPFSRLTYLNSESAICFSFFLPSSLNGKENAS